MKTTGQLPSASPTAADAEDESEETAKPVSLEDGENPTNIALDMYEVKVGCTYVFHKEPQKVWKLLEMHATTAVFSHQPLFGSEEQQELAHSDLKKLRQWVKPLPALQNEVTVKDLQPCLSTKMEMVRAHAQHLLYCKYAGFLGQHLFYFCQNSYGKYVCSSVVIAIAVCIVSNQDG